MELAKIPRVAPDKGKGKASEKQKSVVKEGGPMYDSIEGSIHDVALRRALLRGYEQFKVGFVSISLEKKSLTCPEVDAWILYIHSFDIGAGGVGTAARKVFHDVGLVTGSGGWTGIWRSSRCVAA